MLNSNTVIQTLNEDFAPYAAISNVMEVITRKRERGFSSQLTPTTLETIGIPKGNASRTLQALNYLGLMEEDGTQTELFNRLARAGEAGDEYQTLLQDIIRNSYRRVFEIVDPATSGETAITDAFRQFEPEAQRARMVTFFLGMCEHAGIVQQKERERKARNTSSKRATTQRARASSSSTDIKQTPIDPGEGLPRRANDEDAEYRLVFAVMQQLPSDRQWSADRRQKWLSAVEAAVDLMVDVMEEPRPVPVLMAPRDIQGDEGN